MLPTAIKSKEIEEQITRKRYELEELPKEIKRLKNTSI